MLPHLNSLHVDVKHSDTGIHRQLTGVGNERILENLRRVDEHNLPLPVYIRIPLIPGINDSDANLHKTLQLVSALDKVQRIELLAYHRLGTATYAELGRAYGCEQLEPPSADHLRERRDFLLRLNPSVPVTIAG